MIFKMWYPEWQGSVSVKLGSTVTTYTLLVTLIVPSSIHFLNTNYEVVSKIHVRYAYKVSILGLKHFIRRLPIYDIVFLTRTTRHFLILDLGYNIHSAHQLRNKMQGWIIIKRKKKHCIYYECILSSIIFTYLFIKAFSYGNGMTCCTVQFTHNLQ